jgi:radical SAM family RiPP maturation amino acid epimerase
MAFDYFTFVYEKMCHRDVIMQSAAPDNAALSSWRLRQVERCRQQFGARRALDVVHAPLAIELNKGCSVGCWFCGVDAGPLQSCLPYDESNQLLWHETLTALHAVLGEAAACGFLYWATEPLDNPDYEHFVFDFYSELGAWPQTTTAVATRDIRRTRALIEQARNHGSKVEHFSILSVADLRKVHRVFTADELLHVECVTQNREAETVKARSGRAARVTDSRRHRVSSDPAGSTIACVSGFLLNMVERSIQLVTPCNTTEQWPLGYMVLDADEFSDGASLRQAISRMIDRRCCTDIAPGTVLQWRLDVKVSTTSNSIILTSPAAVTDVACGDFDPTLLASRLGSGGSTVRDLLKTICRDDASAAHLMTLLRRLFQHGLFVESTFG